MRPSIESKEVLYAWIESLEQRIARIEKKYTVGRAPSSYDECLAFLADQGRPDLGEAFWDHGVTCGWTQGRGANPIKDWRAAARLFIRNDVKWNGEKNGKPSQKDLNRKVPKWGLDFEVRMVGETARSFKPGTDEVFDEDEWRESRERV